MKRKKWIYALLLFMIIVPILWLYNAFNGNPASKLLAKKTLDNYLVEKYKDIDFTIDEGFYDFKVKGYQFIVDDHTEKPPLDFTVTGFFKPKVTNDGIYYANLDQDLIQKFSEQATTELTQLLEEKNITIIDAYIYLEVSEGDEDEQTNWHKELSQTYPMRIELFIDVSQIEVEKFLEIAKIIQIPLNENEYRYDLVNINGNRFDNVGGYAVYSVNFEAQQELTLKDVNIVE